MEPLSNLLLTSATVNFGAVDAVGLEEGDCVYGTLVVVIVLVETGGAELTGNGELVTAATVGLKVGKPDGVEVRTGI